jgi:hypothetical protein
MPLSVMATLPDFSVSADLRPNSPLSLKSLMQKYLPGVPPVSDLTVDDLHLTAQPGPSLSITARMADRPDPCVIELGKAKLTISNVQLNADYMKGVGASGAVSGQLSLGGAGLSAFWQVPGDCSLKGSFPACR